MRCLGCGFTPGELTEYVTAAQEEGVTPEAFVRDNEGTFNTETEMFWCTACYIAVGMPLGVAR